MRAILFFIFRNLIAVVCFQLKNTTEKASMSNQIKRQWRNYANPGSEGLM
jgi:hypothetical protein